MAVISVVVTIYNAEQAIPELLQRLQRSVSSVTADYELIFIDDRSKDQSWKLLKPYAAADNRIKIARMVRNFGQHSAISAGLHLANGDYVVMMDGDLQDEPEVIPELYRQIRSTGTEIVYVKRLNRRDSEFKQLGSSLFYRIFSALSGIKTDAQIGTFRIMTRLVRDSFCQFGEVDKYIGGIFYWMDFECGYYEAEHRERKHGRSNYTTKRMVELAINGLLSNSNKPLHIALSLGLISTIGAMLAALYFAGACLFCHSSIPGHVWVLVSMFFMGGLILFVLGVIGRYIGRIYDQVKARPEYLLQEKINF
jgi:dolichol-phosphate mannosyltransferase